MGKLSYKLKIRLLKDKNIGQDTYKNLGKLSYITGYIVLYQVIRQKKIG